MRRVLVTGASRGIGLAIATALARQGAEVIGLARDPSPLDELHLDGVRTLAYDLRGDLSTLPHLVGEPLDAVFASHGIAGSGTLVSSKSDAVRSVLEVNAATVPRLYLAARTALVRSKGAFVVIASQAGLRGEPNLSAYCASKFAVVGWITAYANQARVDGIRLRALCPGMVSTQLLTDAFDRIALETNQGREDLLTSRTAAFPAHRIAAPEEIAAAALFLAECGPTGPVVLNQAGGETLW